MSDNYLIHGTNALSGALRYTTGTDFQYDPRSVEIYLSVACKTLTLLLDDSQALEAISNGIRNESGTKYHHFRNFVDEFVKPDKALMIAAGMRQSAADYLFSDLDNVKKVLRQMEIKASMECSPQWLRNRIEELKHSVCGEEVANSRKPKWKWEIPTALRRSLHVVGGGAIVIANVSADNLIGGIASALSQGFGGHHVMKGVEGDH
jgi:hypothetical protein